MARSETTSLMVAAREAAGSREVRRLRRQGLVPGVVYGGADEPASFQVDARELRLALAHAGAVIDLSFEAGNSSPVVVKELARHPVSGAVVHLDLLRVRLDQAIHSTVALELVGTDDAPGVKEGGVLEHVTRELNIEALPTDIPDSIEVDVSQMVIGDTLTLEVVRMPAGVQLLDDLENVVATLTPPRLQLEEEEGIEEETELVGEEGEEGAEGEAAEGEGGAEAAAGEEPASE